MGKRWTILLLLLLSMAPVSQVGAEPAPEPLPKLTPREEEGFLKFFLYLLQAGAGASEETLKKIETGTRDLTRQRAAARREGIPLTPEEFQRPLPPPELNAAPIYTKLAQVLKEKPLDKEEEIAALRVSPRYHHSPADVVTARKLLADREDVMTLIHEATDRPKCVFQHDWSRETELATAFADYIAARAASRLIKVESLLLALDGRLSEAIATQSRGFRIAAHLAPDGTMLTYGIAISCETITLHGMQDILHLAGPNGEAAEQVRRAIWANRASHSMRRALEGEVLLQIGMMNEVRRIGPQSLFLLSRKSKEEAQKLAAPIEQSRLGQRLWNLLVDAGEADILRKMRRAFAII